MKTNKVRIALFFGGKVSQHLVLVKKAAKKLGVDLDLVSYNRVSFDTETEKIIIRGNIGDESKLGYSGKNRQVSDYDVVFFRTTGKHWEEVDLVIKAIEEGQVHRFVEVDEGRTHRSTRTTVVVDPLVRYGKPSFACKAWQMLKLREVGIDVPKSVYGSLWYLYSIMAEGEHKTHPYMGWPVIIKGSGGDRGTRVFKADSLEDLEKLVRDLRMSEIKEGKRYMLQEYIPNDGDYRVLVLGEKVLGVMKRSRAKCGLNDKEFRNNYSAGGSVEVSDLPEEIKQLALKAAKVCGLAIAGVDVAFRDFDMSKPVIWEVNKGPQFKGFMKATGIDVPAEIVKYLVSLVRN